MVHSCTSSTSMSSLGLKLVICASHTTTEQISPVSGLLQKTILYQLSDQMFHTLSGLEGLAFSTEHGIGVTRLLSTILTGFQMSLKILTSALVVSAWVIRVIFSTTKCGMMTSVSADDHLSARDSTHFVSTSMRNH